ncbi:hypothetical protein Tco_1412728 [Tanacetum coccineum]
MDQVTKHNSVQGTNDHKQKFDDRRTFTTNNNYQNNSNNNSNHNYYHQQQNRRQETIKAYAVTPTENHRYVGNLRLCKMQPASHRTLHCQVSYSQQGGSFDQELQKQRASHWKQPATSNSNLSCLRREGALQKSVPKGKQQCPRKSILAKRQERSPRPERSHGYVLSKPTSS